MTDPTLKADLLLYLQARKAEATVQLQVHKPGTHGYASAKIRQEKAISLIKKIKETL